MRFFGFFFFGFGWVVFTRFSIRFERFYSRLGVRSSRRLLRFAVFSCLRFILIREVVLLGKLFFSFYL